MGSSSLPLVMVSLPLINETRPEIPGESRWACLSLLVDAALSLASPHDAAEAEVEANRTRTAFQNVFPGLFFCALVTKGEDRRCGGLVEVSPWSRRVRWTSVATSPTRSWQRSAQEHRDYCTVLIQQDLQRRRVDSVATRS